MDNDLSAQRIVNGNPNVAVVINCAQIDLSSSVVSPTGVGEYHISVTKVAGEVRLSGFPTVSRSLGLQTDSLRGSCVQSLVGNANGTVEGVNDLSLGVLGEIQLAAYYVVVIAQLYESAGDACFRPTVSIVLY